MTDLLHQAQLLSDLSDNSEVADKLGKAQQAVQLAQSVAGTAGEVAGYLSQGDVLGAGAALLGLGGGLGTPSGLQFTFEVTGLPPMTFSVVSFDYRAHYSELYSLSLHLTSSLPTIPADSVLEQSGCLTIWQDGQSIQTLSGMVSSFAQGDSGFIQTAYFLEVCPDLWRTTLRHNARIFQQKNLQQILTALLSEHGITQYAFAFTQSHPTREFCVQWQESDFEFIQRLSAEEGVFYYFEQRDRQYTLVFSDNAETLSEVQTFPYNLNRNAQLQEKSVYQFLQRHRVKQSGVVLQDYTFKKPDWPAQFQRQSSKSDRKPNPLYEHFDYPGRFKDSEQGKAFTQYRLESLQQDVAEGEGQSNIPQLQVGRLLELSQHSNPAYNTAWQLIEVSCRGEQPQSSEGQAGEKGTYFTNEFKVIPRHQTWRPMQRTKPKVDGPQIARVVGPKGEEIFTDNFGRIRLQFLWDRESQGDDHSSCWIRVTQPWAGQGWGVLAIPRVGQEVLVDFLDGDPDQPIVTGRTYNAQQLPPGGLPQSKTQMAFRSKTYKGEGYNELLFEDAPGREQLNLHAQWDMNVVVLNDKSTTVNGNVTETINRQQVIDIGIDRFAEVQKNANIMVKQQNVNVGKSYQLLSNGNIHFDSKTSIILKTQGAYISISKDKILVQGDKIVTLNGENIFITPDKNSSLAHTQSSGNSDSLFGSIDSAENTVYTLTKTESPDGYLHINQNGIQSKATAFTASSDNGNSSVHMLDMSIKGKNAGLDVRALSAQAELDKNNGISLNSDAVFTKGQVNAQIGDKELGISGSAEAASLIASGDFTFKNYSTNNIYGGEMNLKAKAFLVEAEVKGEFTSRYLNVRAAYGKSVGVGGELGGKILIDFNKEATTAGVSGRLAALVGLKGDLEVDVNYGAIRNDFKGLFDDD